MTFDTEGAREFLEKREREQKEKEERDRKIILEKAMFAIREQFKDSQVEAFLVGSVTTPYSFSPISDVDIVLKNFHGDRFEVWSKLEQKIGRGIEVILYESCHFQDHVDRYGVRIE